MIVRCKHRKTPPGDGGIVDGCGWQGERPADSKCPGCGVVGLLRAIDRPVMFSDLLEALKSANWFGGAGDGKPLSVPQFVPKLLAELRRLQTCAACGAKPGERHAFVCLADVCICRNPAPPEGPSHDPDCPMHKVGTAPQVASCVSGHSLSDHVAGHGCTARLDDRSECECNYPRAEPQGASARVTVEHPPGFGATFQGELMKHRGEPERPNCSRKAPDPTAMSGHVFSFKVEPAACVWCAVTAREMILRYFPHGPPRWCEIGGSRLGEGCGKAAEWSSTCDGVV